MLCIYRYSPAVIAGFVAKDVIEFIGLFNDFVQSVFPYRISFPLKVVLYLNRNTS